MEASALLLQLADYSEPVAYNSLLIPVGVAVWRWRHLPFFLRTLAGLAGYMTLLYYLLRVAAYLWHQNAVVAHMAGIGETVFYLVAFRSVLHVPRRWFTLALVLFLLFAAFDSFIITGFSQLNSYTLALESFLGILLVLVYFEQELRAATVAPIRERPTTIACIGIILYLAGTIMVYSLSNHFIITNDADGNTLLYSVNSVMLLLFMALLTYSFLASAPTPTPVPKQLSRA